MGLLSSIGKAVSSGFSTFVAAVGNPVGIVSAALSPKTTVAEVKQEYFSQPLSKQITQQVTTGITAASLIVGGAAVSTAAKAGTLLPTVAKVATSIIPKTVVGKAAGAAALSVAVPIVAAQVVKNPVSTVKAVANAPQSFTNFESNIFELAKNPSIENLKTLVTENPILTTAVGAGLLLPVAGAAAKTLIPAAILSQKDKSIPFGNNETITPLKNVEVVQTTAQPPISNTQNAPPSTPITPQTNSVNAITSKKRKKRNSKAVMPNISQKVNVIVSNRAASTGISQTKRYLSKQVMVR